MSGDWSEYGSGPPGTANPYWWFNRHRTTGMPGTASGGQHEVSGYQLKKDDGTDRFYMVFDPTFGLKYDHMGTPAGAFPKFMADNITHYYMQPPVSDWKTKALVATGAAEKVRWDHLTNPYSLGWTSVTIKWPPFP